MKQISVVTFLLTGRVAGAGLKKLRQQDTQGQEMYFFGGQHSFMPASHYSDTDSRFRRCLKGLMMSQVKKIRHTLTKVYREAMG